LLSLGLIAINLVVYVPVRHHEFINFDDPQYVVENRLVREGLTWAGVAWAFTTGYAGNWHPLTWLSHMLDVQLFGLDAGAHHLTSVLLHVANTLLLFGLLYRMTGALLRSAFVAALFAVHPLHVESVAWVAERKDVLSTLFFMLTLHAYAAYTRRRRPAGYALVLGLFALGLMAKPMLVTVPFVLLLLDYWPLARARSATRRGLVLEKLPLIALAVASSVVTLVVQQRGGAVKGLDVLPLGRRLANAVVAYAAYLGKTVWPAHLAAIYPYPASLPWGWVAGATFGIIGVSVLALRAARRYPYLPVGWLWYLGTLVPVIGLVQVGGQPTADRYTYIPLVGVFILAAWGTADLVARRPQWRLAVAAAAGMLVVGCAAVARRQVQYWRGSIALWEHAISVTRENYRAENNLGLLLSREGRPAEAIPHFVEALRIKPDFAEAHNNLGFALADQGRTREAIAHYTEAVRLIPAYVEAHNNLGVALSGEGRNDEAIREFQEALRLDPALAVSHNNLGAALAKQGRLEEAVRHFSEALRLDPDYADARRNLALAHNGLGAALADQGRLEEAIAQYSEAVRLGPDLPDGHANLAAALAREGRVDEAIHEFQEAVRLAPDDADLHYDLGVMFLRKGYRADAARHFEAAVKLDPAHEAARRALVAARDGR
jgi:tetratricopeptide (TPR) repeat protein